MTEIADRYEENIRKTFTPATMGTYRRGFDEIRKGNTAKGRSIIDKVQGVKVPRAAYMNGEGYALSLSNG